MDPQELKERIPLSAFAFRGYNVTNLGRTSELLAHPKYGAIVERHLTEASAICTETAGRPIDLVDRVRVQRETGLASYSDAIGLIVAVEQAQLELLQTFFDISFSDVKICTGYSLGEISALVAAQVLPLEDALFVPLSLADDCVALADDVTLGILISRGDPLPLDEVKRLCIDINSRGEGVMGISAYLSPNSALLMGQGKTLDVFRKELKQQVKGITVRKNKGKWPPLHTPIVWEKSIPNRSAVLMHTINCEMKVPEPQLLSLVTGKASYNEFNAREILHRWADHPQRLWDAVYEFLQIGIETLVHVGPAPNIVPATMTRLSDNVEAQTRGSLGMRALSAVVRRPWLKALLPQRTALLRAPFVQQIVLEDWLLEHGDAL